MYQEALKKEISMGYLKKIPIENFDINHPFNFIYLKDYPDKVQIECWFDKLNYLNSYT